MPTTIFDPTSLLRTGIKAWWIANSATLSALGTPVIAADDGSPASTETGELPVSVIRLGEGRVDAITNRSRHHVVAATFEVFGNTRHAATQAIAPLDRLLCDMADRPTNIFALGEGYISGVAVDRFTCRQLSKMRWRASREVQFRITLDRVSA